MGFFWYLLFLTITFVRPGAFAPALAAYRPVAAVMLIGLLSVLPYTLRRKQWPARPAAFANLGLLVLMGGISVAANGWLGGGLRAVADFLPAALAGALTMLNLTTWRRLRIAGWIIVCCMTGLTTLSLDSYYTGYDAHRYVIEDGGPIATADLKSFVPAEVARQGDLIRIRSVGIFADPNDFSQMMLVALALVWGLRWRKGKLRWLFTFALPGAILLWGMYLSHSRGALLGLGMATIAAFWNSLGPTRSAILLGLGGLLAKAVQFSGGRAISDAGESAAHRIDYWNLGLHLTASHPLFGIGMDNFHNLNTQTGQTAHNTFLLCAAELGLFGLFLFVSLLVFSFQSVAEVIRSSSEKTEVQRMATGLRAALAGFLTCAWFLSRTYDPVLYILLGICMAASPAAGRIVSDRRKWILSSALWSFGILVLLYAFVIGQRLAGHS